MLFFTTESIGEKRHLTPSGTLICLEVPIARTGLQIYRDGETPIKPGPEGYVKVEREPEQVFDQETMASFEGVPFVNEHPSENVTPDNWRLLSGGHVQNVRRGEGAQDHLMLADVIVQDGAMIRLINAGKREVSCGYDAEYEELEPGHARQVKIRGNHLALVDSARCGPQCSIQDATEGRAVVIDSVPIRKIKRPIHFHIHL